MSKFIVVGNHRYAFHMYGEYGSLASAISAVNSAYDGGDEGLEWVATFNPLLSGSSAPPKGYTDGTLSAYDGTRTTVFYILEVESLCKGDDLRHRTKQKYAGTNIHVV